MSSLIYEIEIKNGQYEYEVDVDASTGETVSFEQDKED
ncbi:PepSY domain-containing protein [Lysinibacillus sphaericus]